VPSAAYDLGRRVWWPRHLRADRADAPVGSASGS
jgi:hypothetical protein